MITFRIMEFSLGDGWVLALLTRETLLLVEAVQPVIISLLSLTHAYNSRQVAAIETRTGVCGEGGLFPAAAPASPARLKVRVLFKPEEDQEHKMFGSQFVRTRGSWEQWRN